MANRSHIYTFSKESSVQHKDLSEWKWAIPIAHQLLVSGQPRAVHSHVWNNDDKIAIEADFDPGLARLFRFLHWFAQQEGVSGTEVLERQIRRTQEFFERRENRKPLALLEAAEIFVLNERIPLGQQTESEIREIEVLAAEVDRLTSGEGSLATSSVRALQKLGDTWEDELGLYWTDVVYFSLNEAVAV